MKIRENYCYLERFSLVKQGKKSPKNRTVLLYTVDSVIRGMFSINYELCVNGLGLSEIFPK